MPTLQLTQSEANLLNELFSTIADLDLNETTEDSDSETFDSLWDKVVKLWSHFYYLITMTTFTINNKEYTHKELNLMWDFFTPDQWNNIIQSNTEDDEIVSTIQQLWRSSY